MLAACFAFAATDRGLVGSSGGSFFQFFDAMLAAMLVADPVDESALLSWVLRADPLGAALEAVVVSAAGIVYARALLFWLQRAGLLPW